MRNIIKSLQMAFASLFRLRMIFLMLFPPLLGFGALSFLFIFFWSDWSSSLAPMFSGIWGIQWFQQLIGFVDLGLWMAAIFLVLLFLPLAYVLSIIIVSLVVMPLVLKWVGDTDFKYLKRRRGGSTLGSIWNTLSATVIFLVAFFVTLPLWLVPGLQVVVPLVLTSWFNKKVFLYDVLQDFASKEERRRIGSEEKGSLFLLGIILGLFSYIPLAFLIAPLITALGYTYYGLNALADRRK